jgi:hypothetical protein
MDNPTKGIKSALDKRISQIPTGDGFWRKGSREVYQRVGWQLFLKGFTPDEIVELLTELYRATAEEFGE